MSIDLLAWALTFAAIAMVSAILVARVMFEKLKWTGLALLIMATCVVWGYVLAHFIDKFW